jgi:hypothetical protein
MGTRTSLKVPKVVGGATIGHLVTFGDNAGLTIVDGGAPGGNSGTSGADFTNAGNPQGVVTAVGGQTCRDTTNGILYAHLPLASSNTGWYPVRMQGAGGAWQMPYFQVQASQIGGANGNLSAFGPNGNPSTMFNITNASQSLAYGQSGTAVRLSTTVATDANGFYMDTGSFDADIDMDVVWRLRTDAATVAHVRYFAVITTGNTSGDNLPGRGYGFRFSTNASDAGWVGIVKDSAQSTTASIASVVANTVYILRMRKVGGTIYFSVNDGPETVQTTNVPASGALGQLNLYLHSFSGTETLDFFSFGGQIGNVSGGAQ